MFSKGLFPRGVERCPCVGMGLRWWTMNFGGHLENKSCAYTPEGACQWNELKWRMGCLKLRPFIVWKLWPGQKFEVKSVLFQKSGADTCNFRTQTAIQILRPRCTTRHQGDSLWQVSNNSDGNCRRSCAHKKLLTDGRTDGRTYRTDLLGLICSCSNVNFLTPQTT